MEMTNNARASQDGTGKEGHRMSLTDGLKLEIQVGADPARASVELKIAATAEDGARAVRLNREEARRLAALLLFQAARLERSEAGWRSLQSDLERRSA